MNGHDLAALLRSEAARADAQAGLMLAALGVAAAVGHAPGGWALVPWWVGLAATAAGAGLLGAVVYPRVPPRRAGPPTVLLCAWDVLAAAAAGVLGEAYSRTACEGDEAAEQAQLATLAAIVARKFTFVRMALRALAAAGLLVAVALAGGG